MKRMVALMLALVLGAVGLTSCSKETEAEIYYPVSEDFSSLDPQIASGASAMTVAFNCYEGLVRLDENGEIVPAGADSWEVSSDSKTYTFHLRHEAQWYLTNSSKEELSHEDTEKSDLPADFDTRVTAKDYVFGLRRAVDPNTGADDGRFLSAVSNAAKILDGQLAAEQLGAVAVDDYTLRITLDYADPDFLYYLTRLVASPCNQVFFEACKGRYGLAMEYVLCNGAYMVYRWTAGSVIRLEKNSRYNGASPALNDRVWVYYIEDAEGIAQRVESGTYDAGYIDAAYVNSFSDSFKIQPMSNVIWGYWFNAQSDIFSVANMRTAFAASADRSVLNRPEYIEGEFNRLLTGSLSPNYDFTPTLVAYDEARAAELYRGAIGESDVITASMTLTVLTSEEFSESVIRQVQIWQRVFGIDVKLRTETRERALALFAAGDYEAAFLPFTVAAANTSEFFRMFMSDSSYNLTGYADPGYDSLINSVSNTMSEDEKINVYRQCEQKIISDAVVIPAFTQASYFVQGKDFSGMYTFSENEIYFRNATENT